MNKRQYTFLLLMIILFYLSFRILEYEYKKYTISQYISSQLVLLDEMKEYFKGAKKTIKYVNTKAFKNKILKSEDQMKMKGEEVIILTSEKLYKKFSGKIIIPDTKIQNEIVEKEISNSMTNFQKWIYFFLKKDIR